MRAALVAAAALWVGCGHAPARVEQPEAAVPELAGRLEVTLSSGEREVRVTGPSGERWEVGAFEDGGVWRARFTPREAGLHRWTTADGARAGAFVATAPRRDGFVAVDPEAPTRLVRADGRPFVPLGVNRFNVYDPRWNWQGKDIEAYVAYMASHGLNTIRVFVFGDCEDESSREQGGDGAQVGCLEPAPGRFDPEVARRFDRLFDAAEAHGVQVVLTAYAVGFTPAPETWKSWDDNPWSTARGGPVDGPHAFFEPAHWDAARARLDIIARRWGHSPSFLALDLLNEPEWDGGVPEALWHPWAAAMAAHWARVAPHDQPVTVGSVGLHWNIEGDEHAWWGDAACDLVQWHLYGPEIYDTHALAAEMTRKVRETQRHGKPILVGEFGWGGEDRALWDHTHVGLWSAYFSGAAALSHAAPVFNVDSDAPLTPERARRFTVLGRFVAALEPHGNFTPVEVVAEGPEGVTAWALAGGDARAVWLLGPKAGYGEGVAGATVTWAGMTPGTYRLRWYDDAEGTWADGGAIEVGADGVARAAAPEFVRHIAGLLDPSP